MVTQPWQLLLRQRQRDRFYSESMQIKSHLRLAIRSVIDLQKKRVQWHEWNGLQQTHRMKPDISGAKLP